jgi:hypothetical protein
LRGLPPPRRRHLCRSRSRSSDRPPSSAAGAAGGRPVTEPIDCAGLRDLRRQADERPDRGRHAGCAVGGLHHAAQAGRTIVIPRREIRQLTVLGQSTMPADLDKAISPEEMADLLAYVTKR